MSDWPGPGRFVLDPQLTFEIVNIDNESIWSLVLRLSQLQN